MSGCQVIPGNAECAIARSYRCMYLLCNTVCSSSSQSPTPVLLSTNYVAYAKEYECLYNYAYITYSIYNKDFTQRILSFYPFCFTDIHYNCNIIMLISRVFFLIGHDVNFKILIGGMLNPMAGKFSGHTRKKT